MTIKRLYSTAMLLPDARVLVAGERAGRRPRMAGPTMPTPRSSHRPICSQRSPPDEITAAPASVTYGAKILVQTPDAATIDKVRLVRLGSVHAHR